MQGLLTNQVAIMTGASRERGIGLATARLFAEHGATVVITDPAIEDPLRAAAELGSGHLGLSSMSAQQGGGVFGGTHYCAAKAGVIGMAKAFPLRRIGRPVDIAGACLYLASDLAAFTTGTTLDVNGGAHIR